MKRAETTGTNIMDKCFIIVAPIVGCIVVMLILHGNSFSMDIETGNDLVKTMINIWGVLLGFIITAVSILLTIGDNGFIKFLIKANHMSNIILSYVLASLHLFFALIYSVVVLFTGVWGKKIALCFVGVNITVLISVGMCLYLLFLLVLRIQRSDDDENGI